MTDALKVLERFAEELKESREVVANPEARTALYHAHSSLVRALSRASADATKVEAAPERCPKCGEPKDA